MGLGGPVQEGGIVTHRRTTMDEFREMVESRGLTLERKSPGHWQIKGGPSIVNIHANKRISGFTLYVQGMSGGKQVKDLAAVFNKATKLPSVKARRKKNYRRLKQTMWGAMVTRGITPACKWCEKPFSDISEATADHVIPLSKGGSNGSDNIVLACSDCNTKRRNEVTGDELTHVNATRLRKSGGAKE